MFSDHPQITLRPSINLATFVDNDDDLVSASLFIELSNPGTFSETDFTFSYSVYGVAVGIDDLLVTGTKEGATSAEAGVIHFVIARNWLQIESNPLINFNRAYDSLKFSVSGSCSATSPDCSRLLTSSPSPLSEKSLTLPLVRRPIGIIQINQHVAVANNPLSVSVSGWTTRTTTPYLYFGFTVQLFFVE